MGIYSRSLQKYNLLKNFRVRNGTVWSYSRSLVFWLQSPEQSNTFVDKSRNVSSITAAGTGFTNSKSGPEARFKLNALDFNNEYLTVSNGEAADATYSKSLVFTGWVYLDVSPGLNNQGFSILQTDATTGWSIFVDDNGKLGIRLSNYADSTHYDGTGTATLASSTWRTATGVVQSSGWTHFAIAVDKAVATETIFRNSATSPTIMINGKKQSITSTVVGSPGSLDPKTAAASYRIGYGPAKDETQAKIYLDGSLAGLALFQPDEDLTEAKLATLYQASRDGAYVLGSGFISTSPFNVLNDAMHRDTHPTVSRLSNDGRTGNHAISFDDSRAMHITNTGPTSFPSMLTEDNPLFSTVYNGIDNGQLTTTAASASFGILDEYYEESNSVAITPFIESKVYINSGSSFYQTGTADLPGFDQSLRNKSIITFKLENGLAKQLGINRSANDGDEIPYLAYYNFTDKKFEHNGVVTRMSNGASQRAIHYFTGSHVGFAPIESLHTWDGTAAAAGTSNEATQTDIDAWSKVNINSFNLPFNSNQAKVAGGPTDVAGFPSDERYVPKQDQIFTLSEYTDKPFLLEKITVKFKIYVDAADDYFTYKPLIPFRAQDGSYKTLWENQIHYQLPTFFIGRTYNDNFSINKNVVLTAGSLGFGAEPFDYEIKSEHKTNELISYMQAFLYYEDESTDLYDGLDPIIADDFSFDYKKPLTGQDTGTFEFCIESTPKLINKAASMFPIRVNNTNKYPMLVAGYTGGPTKLYNDISERSLTKSIMGTSTKSEDFNRVRWLGYPNGAGTGTDLQTYLDSGFVIPVQSNFANNPKATASTYILNPKDKLFFGFGAPMGAQTLHGNSDSFSRGAFTIPVQEVEIQLFGSEIASDKVASTSHGQILGTHTVHEHIGDAVRDQFLINLPGEYSGSFSDDVISGSFNAGSIYEGYDQITGETIKLARRVGGRASQGTQGETGALKINNRLVDTSERDYDSIMPDFREIASIDDTLFGESQNSALSIGTISFGTATVASASHWLYSFPFESRYASLNRTHTITKPSGERQSRYKLEFRDAIAGTSIIDFSNTGTLLTGSIGFAPRNSEDSLAGSNQGSINQDIPEKDVIRLLFGAGDMSRGRYFSIGADSDGDRIGVNLQNSGGTINLGGFKYGVSNSSAAYSSAVYRRDRFGQLRDLLEPRCFMAYMKDSKVSFPVSQRFFSRTGQPLSAAERVNTTCSNLSQNATSSLPFFDRPNNSSPRNKDTDTSAYSPINISPNFAPAQGPFTGLQ